MEDAHLLGARIEGGNLFGVFDGHCGAEVARFVARHMAQELRKEWVSSPEAELKYVFHRMDDLVRDPGYRDEIESLKNKPPGEEEGVSGRSTIDALNALKASLKREQAEEEEGGEEDSTGAETEGGRPAADLFERRRRCPLPDHDVSAGCTAVAVAVLDDGRVFCANAGDSRAVLCRNGQALPLSHDHKPASPVEMERITHAGGFVQCVNGIFRINGNLNLSRAIGDLKYKANVSLEPKDQIITAEPDVIQEEIQLGRDQFIIIACDGIWDCVTNQEAVDFVKERLVGTESTLSQIAEQLLFKCVSRENPARYRGQGGDNMTCLIVQFAPPQQLSPSPSAVSP